MNELEHTNQTKEILSIKLETLLHRHLLFLNNNRENDEICHIIV